MLHQRRIIHSLVGAAVSRQNLSRQNPSAAPNAFFPYQILDESSEDGVTASLPKEAKVVVCGGGVMGAAVAYHLAELGLGPQTVLVDKGRCGGGTTWHLSGLVGVFKPSLTQVKLAQFSVQLYKDMEARGLKTGWKQCGSLCIARTRDRMTVFRRMKAQSVQLACTSL